MKQVIITIIATIAVIAIIGQISIYNDKKNASYDDVSKETFSQAYLQGCKDTKNTNELVNQSKLNKYCNCTWDNLSSRFSAKKISEISVQYNETNKLPQEMLNAMNDCLWILQ